MYVPLSINITFTILLLYFILSILFQFLCHIIRSLQQKRWFRRLAPPTLRPDIIWGGSIRIRSSPLNGRTNRLVAISLSPKTSHLYLRDESKYTTIVRFKLRLIAARSSPPLPTAPLLRTSWNTNNKNT